MAIATALLTMLPDPSSNLNHSSLRRSSRLIASSSSSSSSQSHPIPKRKRTISSTSPSRPESKSLPEVVHSPRFLRALKRQTIVTASPSSQRRSKDVSAAVAFPRVTASPPVQSPPSTSKNPKESRAHSRKRRKGEQHERGDIVVPVCILLFFAVIECSL